MTVPHDGVYTLRFRVANAYSDAARFELRSAGGNVLGSLAVPRTGGWQSWQTISTTTHLSAGTQLLRLQAVQGDWNINWLEAAESRPLPAKLEAESFDVATDVRPESTSDEGVG
ncbi:carbohydrate-binding protein [Spirosoma sp. KNUC1025]|uniref:carbohydrate-binding protein n=1 Tax=Spirosoma sp. KNUC1025 TaxID=2894082 RepID=UPI003868B483|nr:carbohydrate-binding protein [Spirosoma sp. KNUC1025]